MPEFWFLLTLFLCPNGENREAICGPSTGNYGPYRTEKECVTVVQEYVAAQERARVGFEYRYKCWPVRIG
jgi:hypothetical protein